MTTRLLPTDTRSATPDTRQITANPPTSPLPIYTRHLLRQSARSAIIWALAFGLYVGMIVLIWPSFRDSGALDAVTNYPEGLKKAFSFENELTITSFLGAEVYSYAPLVLAFFPIMAFSGAIAGAEERDSLDMLLGTPMPRRHLVISTWISVTLLLLAVLVVTGLISWLSSLAVGAHLSLTSAMAGALGVFPIALAFGSLALLFSALMRQRGEVIGASFGVMFLMYLLDIVGKVATDYDWLRWGSAFRFYGQPIVDGVSWGNVVVLLVASVVLLAVTIPVFDRRDIYT